MTTDQTSDALKPEMPSELERLICSYTKNDRNAINRFWGVAEMCGYKLIRADIHDARVSDLLEANNRLLERARVAEAALRQIANDPYKFGQRIQAMKKIAADALAKIAARKEGM